MKFETIVAPTITELFEKQIQSAILSGELQIGEKLPTEQDLADSMNVSKSIVHIGIKNLERMGFVRIAPATASMSPTTRKRVTLIPFWRCSGTTTESWTRTPFHRFSPRGRDWKAFRSFSLPKTTRNSRWKNFAVS